ncbi:MAG: sensor domain-containing diguanylate cyclase [Bdellovibrionota bacterium]
MSDIFHSLAVDQLTYFLERHRKSDNEVKDFDFNASLKKILEELKEFVPSEGCYILLDDPLQVVDEGQPKNLVYIAGFGEKAEKIIGLKTAAFQGLISQAYRLGNSQILKVGSGEPAILDKIHLPKEVKDAVCIPLKISNTTIGVLAIYNKQDSYGFSIKDIRMINILSSYLCMSIQMAIDTKKNKELTKRDNLTGLYNDRFFHIQLEKEIFSAERNKTDLILMFMDLDYFKSINDQHGHIVGSRTLKEIGFVLREVIQVPNATLARYGGDEYVCILPGIKLEKALEIANQVREKITEKMFMIDRGHEDGSFVSFKGLVSASIGLASLHDHTLPIDDTRQRKNTLVRLADQAMYDAKDQGKNRVCISRGITQ